MDYQIIQIDEQTWRIEDGGVRFFLLTGAKRALLIDSGMTAKNAREIAESLTKLPISLLNTHADRDHVAGNGRFNEALMNPAECANYRSAVGCPAKIIPVWDGDIIDLGERPIEIITIPGHTPGSVALLDKTRRVLYSGDSVQNGSIFMFGRFRDVLAYPHSLRKLLRFEDKFDKIFPSHADFPLDPEVIPALIEGVQRLMNGEFVGEDVTMFGTQIKKFDIGPASLLCDSDLAF